MFTHPGGPVERGGPVAAHGAGRPEKRTIYLCNRV
jgi:hypothetical protein